MQQSRKRTYAAWPLATPENMIQRERAPAAAALQGAKSQCGRDSYALKATGPALPMAYSAAAPELAVAASAEPALARLAGAAAPLPVAGFAGGASPSVVAGLCDAPHTCVRGPRRLGAGSLGAGVMAAAMSLSSHTLAVHHKSCVRHAEAVQRACRLLCAGRPAHSRTRRAERAGAAHPPARAARLLGRGRRRAALGALVGLGQLHQRAHLLLRGLRARAGSD
jgi:hypothetical protein